MSPPFPLANLLRGRPWNEPLIQMNRYDLSDVAALRLDHGVTEFHAVLERPRASVIHDKAVLYLRKTP